MSTFKIVGQSSGIKEITGEFDKMTAAEQKMVRQLIMADTEMKKFSRNKKKIGEFEKGFGKLKSSLIGLAAPASIFAGIMAKVKTDLEHTLKMAEEANKQNTSYSKSKASLFTNDRMFKNNPALRKEFDDFFLVQGKRSEGLIDQLPAAVAEARSKTAALNITKDPKFLKLAIESAVNDYEASLGESDLESSIVAVSQIAERDKRNVSQQQKVFSAEAQKAEFQSQSATSASEAAAIIPRALNTLSTFGSKEEILATQSFATNAGLTQETALSGIAQLSTKLSKHSKTKKFQGSDFERLFEAANLLDQGKLKETDFAGTELTILNAIRSNPQGLKKFVSDLQGAQQAKGSTSTANLQAQIKDDPELAKIIAQRAAKGEKEVKNLQDKGGLAIDAAIQIGKDKLEGSGVSGSQTSLTNNAVKAGVALGFDSDAVERAYDYSNLVSLADKTFLGSNLLYQANPFINDNTPEGRAKLRKEVIQGTLSEELIDSSDGFDKKELERLRVSGASEPQIKELTRLSQTNTAEMVEYFKEMISELKKANAQREKQATQNQPAPATQPGELD